MCSVPCDHFGTCPVRYRSFSVPGPVWYQCDFCCIIHCNPPAAKFRPTGGFKKQSVFLAHLLRQCCNRKKFLQQFCSLGTTVPVWSLLARDSIYAIARYMPSPVRPSVRPSVCPSLCLSHGWISQRRLKLGSRNFHHRVAP